MCEPMGAHVADGGALRGVTVIAQKTAHCARETACGSNVANMPANMHGLSGESAEAQASDASTPASTLADHSASSAPSETHSRWQVALRTSSVRLGAWTVIGLLWIGLTARFLLSYHLKGELGEAWGVADDAYITADFARTFAQGDGLRWYPGAPKVEGFSSPLWVLALAALHRLPGFSEENLGLFVFGLNAVILLVCAWALLRAIESTRALAAPEPREVPLLWLVLGTLLLLVGTLSFCVWVSRGFEVAPCAMIGLLAYVEAVRPGGARPVRFGVLLGLAVWARMDAILYCVPAFIVFTARTRDRKVLARSLASFVGLVAVLLFSRIIYYGDVFPNTYYLKATQWPVAARLPYGLVQNCVAVAVTVVGLPVLLFVLLRRAGKERLLPIAAIAGHVVVLAYSTCLGGDFGFEALGYDRFTGIGVLFLVLGVLSTLLIVRVRPLARLALFGWCSVIVSFPLIFRPPFGWLPHSLAEFFNPREIAWKEALRPDGLLLPTDTYSQLFMHWGIAMRGVSWPGARFALCPAGATVYFSHRGGVDLLGKVDPLIARLKATSVEPPDRRCWGSMVGHNKEDSSLSFRTHAPELSLVAPPTDAAPSYVKFKYQNVDFWARRGSSLVKWENVWPNLLPE